MKPSSKRRAADEPTPARASKRQAATPPTARLTRAAYKQLHADNNAAGELHPGLELAPRRRKRAPATAGAEAAPKPCAQVAASATERERRPATTYAASVVYAVSATPDRRAPLAETRRQQATWDACSLGAPWLHAANPGGPAPVAYMGGTIPLTIVSTGPPAPAEGSPLISPRSGPPRACAPPSPPLMGPPPASSAPGASAVEGAWSLFRPGWVAHFVDRNHAANRCKRPEGETQQPAITEATYTVESLAEAAELFANEHAVHEVEQRSEHPVVEISVPKSPVDLVHGEAYCSQMIVDTKAPTVSNVAVVDCPPSHDTIVSKDTPSAKHSAAPSQWKAAAHANLPRKSSTAFVLTVSEAECDRGSARSRIPNETVERCLPSPPMQGASPPQPMPPVTQQTANVEREKKLRAHLIHLRKARLRTRQQNVVARAPNSSLSIAGGKQDTQGNPSWPPHWTEEDQYSVEEYDEDTVSY